MAKRGAPKRFNTRPLNERQLAFCDEFIKDLSVHAAALRAGFTPVQARKNSYLLMRDPRIQVRVKELQTAATMSVGLTPEEILRRLIRIATAAENAGDNTAALRALELLGKHFAMFTDKQVQEVTIKNPFSSGGSIEDMRADIARLTAIARPLIEHKPSPPSPIERDVITLEPEDYTEYEPDNADLAAKSERDNEDSERPSPREFI